MQTMPAAAARLRNPNGLQSPVHRTNQFRANWDGVHPDLKKWALAFIQEAARYGVPLYVHTAKRTKEEQRRLFEKGRSQLNTVGAHTKGYAVDIVHSFYHWDMTEREWAWLHELGKDVARMRQCPMYQRQTWGGKWRFYDPAHWEMTGWRDLPEVKNSITSDQVIAHHLKQLGLN